MNYYIGVAPDAYALTHHGIKGMRWGVRRYQNEDGSFTEAGRQRYGIGKAAVNVAIKLGNKREAGYKKRGQQLTPARPEARSERSNWAMLDRVKGRKINASYDARKRRGEKLAKAGRTRIGAVGRYVGRDLKGGLAMFGASFAVGVGGTALNAATGGKYSNAISTGSRAISKVLSVTGTLYTGANLVRTYQDIADMTTYKRSLNK